MGSSREERLLNGSVYLAPYNRGWVDQYESEAGRLREILGDAVLALEHVGSTSIPGLSAKPVIDMILVVADSRAENTYVRPLERRDYQLRIREPDWFQHRQLYEAAKQRLAAKKWKYVQHYDDAKSDVIREILARADQAQVDGSPDR